MGRVVALREDFDGPGLRGLPDDYVRFLDDTEHAEG